MNVFDFDNTLYRGESSIDFAVFLIGKNKKIIAWLPVIFFNLVRYRLCLISRKKMTKLLDDFCGSIMGKKEDIPDLVRCFWESHAQRLNPEILRLVSPEDVIITAGPDLLLDGIKEKLPTSRMICSEFDPDQRRFVYLNFKENKVRRFRELFGSAMVDRLYTDSFNDRALMEISREVFLVKKGKPVRIS